MPSFVVDNSVSASWYFKDEQSEFSVNLLRSLYLDPHSRIFAPSIWPEEAANAILMAAKRNRITPEEVAQCFELLIRLPITVEPANLNRSFSDIPLLARKHNLTSYDASYLEIAIRRCLPIASFDKQLLKAAFSEDVTVLK